MKRVILLLAAASGVAADQLSKWYFAVNYSLGQSTEVVGNLVKFTYIHNDGAAMGMLSGAPWIFNTVTVAVVLMGIILLVTGRIKSSLLQVAATLIVSGGMGNMIDRLARGYVVDFIDCSGMFFPWIFNLADCFVVVGCGVIILYYIIDTVREIKGRADNVAS